jgi:hypothetical protein
VKPGWNNREINQTRIKIYNLQPEDFKGPMKLRFSVWRSNILVGAGVPLGDKVFTIRFDQNVSRTGFFAEFWASYVLKQPSAIAARGNKDFCKRSS